MFISKSDFKFKPEKFDEMVDFANSMMPELSQIRGCKGMFIIRTGEDSSTTIATYDSKENAEAATPQIQQILSRMGEFVTAPPVRNLHEAVVYEQF